MTAAEDRLWDAIVIGTGIGGGTVGRALAEGGQKVLFLEKGPAGHRSERQGLDPMMADPVARQLRGYWPTRIRARLNGQDSAFFGPIGSGLGGSSVFYAATLERPERHDLDATPDRPHPTGGWPVGHDAMRPWFDAAERLFEISGTPDPLSREPEPGLRPPPPISEGDRAMMRAFEAAGLHPYTAHSAIRHVEGCLGCLGTKCPKPCKMDGRSAGVEPALATGNATLLDNCEVTRLVGGPGRITHVKARRGGATLQFSARTYVLAGGALASPGLLLRSASEAWPQGCANASGLVGRNLMFHLNEMIAIWPPREARGTGPSKAISLRDFYHLDGQRFGTFQAMGIDASYGEIVHFLTAMLDRSALRRFGLLKTFTRIPALAAERLFGTAKVFVGLMEDLPYAQNRVVVDPADPQALCVEYAYAPELLTRRRAFRRAISRSLRGQRRMFLTWQPELNFGHPSGTLRFGDDPAESVLRADCRAHDLDNLYVADASFMPTSMGVNPSLTIAANALRVADAILSRSAAT